MSRSRVGGLAALAVLASLLVVAVLRLGPLHQPGSSAEPSPWPTPAEGSTTAAAAEPEARIGRTGSALTVLRAWDARRAAAYAGGSPVQLSGLYVPGSRAGAADVRLLSAYRSRGLRVVQMRTQLLALEVLRADPGRWVLRVQDRLASAVVVADGRRRLLPRDAADTRTITLLHAADGSWRVSSVLR